MKILILGVNGFIGNALTRAHPRRPPTGRSTAWTSSANKLEHSLGHPRFHFLEGDITINKRVDRVPRQEVRRRCCRWSPSPRPATYVKEPLRVFELDFEENLRVDPPVREVPASASSSPPPPRSTACAPTRSSTRTPARWSRPDRQAALDLLLLQAAPRPRDLRLRRSRTGCTTRCFRPFNWIGPKLDDIDAAKEGRSRVVTQFIVNLVPGQADPAGGRRRAEALLHLGRATASTR